METPISFSALLLAGGQGSRMNSVCPKQYLALDSKTVAHYSLECFLSLPELQQLVIVCNPSYQAIFQEAFSPQEQRVIFASSGTLRQESVFNGFKALTTKTLICVHDVARPFVSSSLIRQVVREAHTWGAAAAALPAKATIKRSSSNQFVCETLERATLWEMQTPQVLRYSLIEEGFAHLSRHPILITDDVMLAEQLGQPVKLVKGEESNIKLTTPEDLLFAHSLLSQRKKTNVLL